MDGLPPSADLMRALDAIARLQKRWLRDAESTCTGDPRFLDAFRRWEEVLTMLKVHLHRAEQRLLHYTLVPDSHRSWREFHHQRPDTKELFRAWLDRFEGYFHGLRLDTSYRRLVDILDPYAEATTADVVSDLVALAVTAESTGAALDAFARAGRREYDESLEDLAFYHVLSPWKHEGMIALFDVLRWLHAFLAERDEL